jgi:hypothetical protein
LQALLLSEGTHGLINSLREHVPGKGWSKGRVEGKPEKTHQIHTYIFLSSCQVGAPPPSREWITIEETNDAHDTENDGKDKVRDTQPMLTFFFSSGRRSIHCLDLQHPMPKICQQSKTWICTCLGSGMGL